MADQRRTVDFRVSPATDFLDMFAHRVLLLPEHYKIRATTVILGDGPITFRVEAPDAPPDAVEMTPNYVQHHHEGEYTYSITGIRWTLTDGTEVFQPFPEPHATVPLPVKRQAQDTDGE